MKHLFFALRFTAPLTQAAPAKLIFDTARGNDVDDLTALCMIHNLQKRGACELLGEKARPVLPALRAALMHTKPMFTRWSLTGAINQLTGDDTPVLKRKRQP